MPLNPIDSEALRKTTPLLIIDGDPTELTTALYYVVFNRNDIRIIMEQATSAEKIIKLVELYTLKAKSLTQMEKALKEYAAQPHIFQQIEENRKQLNHSIFSHLLQENVTANIVADPMLEQIIHLLQQSYLKGFARFRPLPHFKRCFDISKIWINLQLENKAESEPPEDYHTAIIDALTESPFAIVKGQPGIGKTMTQKRIAYDWANGNLREFDLVLFARLRDIASDEQTCLDVSLNWLCDRRYLKENHKEWFLGQIGNLVSNPNLYGTDTRLRVLVLLDGLDEFSGHCVELDKLLYSEDMLGLDYSVLLTSRPEILEDVVSPAPTMVINPLTKSQVNEYVMKHFTIISAAYAKARADKFAHRLNESTVWATLAQIPLLLCCMCFVMDKITSGSIGELLLKVCQSLAKQRQSSLAFNLSQSCANICQNSAVIANLARMAFFGLMSNENGKKVVFSPRDLKEFDVDEEKCLHAGFLVSVADSDDGEIESNFEFLHLTFQELFASLLVISELDQLKYGLPPRYPEFTTYKSRLKSFTGWPSEKTQTPQQMAMAGYFHTGLTDGTCCFCCGLSIRCWDKFDLPFWAHAAESPSCGYLSFVKAKEYISLVLSNPSLMDQHTMNEDMAIITDNLDFFSTYINPVFTAMTNANSVGSVTQIFRFLLEMASQENTPLELISKVSALFTFIGLASIVEEENGMSSPLFDPLLHFVVSVADRQKSCSLIGRLHNIFVSESNVVSLLSAVVSLNLAIYNVCKKHAVWIPDINTLFVFGQDANFIDEICGQELPEMPFIEVEKVVGCCLVDYKALSLLAYICNKCGWKKIDRLRINLSESDLKAENLKVFPEAEVALIKEKLQVVHLSIHLDFSAETIFQLKALSSELLALSNSYYSIRIGAKKPTTVCGLPEMLNGMDMSNASEQENRSTNILKHLNRFSLDNVSPSKTDMLSLIGILEKKCAVSMLGFNSVQCLKEPQTFARFCESIRKIPKLYFLGLKHNYLSIQQIRSVCTAFKPVPSMRTARTISIHGNLVNDQQLQMLKAKNPGLSILT